MVCVTTPTQKVSLHQALRGITINAAYCLHRDNELGSLEEGKFADFVELAADPYEVDPGSLMASCAVRATWLGGRRNDSHVFITEASAIEQTPHHESLRAKALG